MAKFIVNSTGTRAICKEQIRGLMIDYDAAIGGDNPSSAVYSLRAHFIASADTPMIFEQDETLVGLQAKAATVLEALEAE